MSRYPGQQPSYNPSQPGQQSYGAPPAGYPGASAPGQQGSQPGPHGYPPSYGAPPPGYPGQGAQQGPQQGQQHSHGSASPPYPGYNPSYGAPPPSGYPGAGAPGQQGSQQGPHGSQAPPSYQGYPPQSHSPHQGSVPGQAPPSYNPSSGAYPPQQPGQYGAQPPSGYPGQAPSGQTPPGYSSGPAAYPPGQGYVPGQAPHGSGEYTASPMWYGQKYGMGTDYGAIQAQFERVDQQRRGQINSHDVSAALTALGHTLSYPTVSKLVAMFDADRSGFISLNEFVPLVNFVNSLHAKFRAVDRPGTAGQGLMDFAEMRTALTQEGFSFKQATLKMLYDKFAGDYKNAGLSFEQFLSLACVLGSVKSHFEKADSKRAQRITVSLDDLVGIVAAVYTA